MSWRVFAVLYTLGVTGYALGAKFASGKISPTFGAFVMTICSLLVIAAVLIFTQNNQSSLSYTRNGLIAAGFAGVGIALADIAIFYMYSRGAQLSIAGVLTEVLSVTVLACIGILLLKEPLTALKMLGFIFSIVGIVLLIRA